VPPILIVNADDFNLTEGVTRGIADAHRYGIVTSTTVMVNLPGLERSRDLAREAPRLGVGLHLNLTFGPSVLPPVQVTSLVDGAGWFIRDPAHAGEAGDPSEIQGEMAAQAERFEAVFGARPSHLDTHHNLHRYPRVFEVLLDLADGLDIPVRALTPEMASLIRERRLPAVDRAVGDVGIDAYWTADRLRSILATIRDGITELVCHPGYADAALSISSYCGQREVELRALRDPGVKGVLAEGGFRCIGYGELAAILASR
jgi:chitin disaccharide deacetylase